MSTGLSGELLQTLNDAGFAKKVSCSHRPTETCACYGTWQPTLEELIEACGDRFCQLVKWDKEKAPEGRWAAVGQYPYNDSNTDDTEVVRFDCDTPEEAVANLWLALNEYDNH